MADKLPSKKIDRTRPTVIARRLHLLPSSKGTFISFSGLVLGSIAQKIADLRTVNGLMASRTPAGSATQKRGVIHIADINCAGGCLLLEMATQTKCRVARNEQSGVHAPM